MSLPHKFSRDEQGHNAACLRRGRGEAETSRSGSFVGEEHAGQLRDSHGSSRRSADVPPSLLAMDHRTYPHCTHAGFYGHPDAMERGHEMEAAMSAPACTDVDASLVTWQGARWRARQTVHYHHHFHHHDWPSGPMSCGHAYQTACCCALKTPHNCGRSHGAPPINYPVNISGPIPGPSNPDPVPTAQLMRFSRDMQEDEQDLYASAELRPPSPRPSSAPAADAAFCSPEPAAEDAPAAAQAAAPPLAVFRAGPPPAHLTHPRPQLPPFPSSHASPYLLCQHCCRLLLVPRGIVLFPPRGIRLLHSFLLVKLKCGYCSKVSKFSTRHLRIRSSEPLPQNAGSSGPPIPSSSPTCIASNAVMRELSLSSYNLAEEVTQELPERPLNAACEPALKSESVAISGSVEGNLEQTMFEAGSPLHGAYARAPNTNHIECSAPLNGIHKNSAQIEDAATHTLGNGNCVKVVEDAARNEESLRGDIAHLKKVGTGAIQNGPRARSEEIVDEADHLDGRRKESPQTKHVSDAAQSSYGGTSAIQIDTCAQSKIVGSDAESHNGTCENTAQFQLISDAAQSKNVGTRAIGNGTCARCEEITIEAEPLHVNGTCEKAPQPKYTEAGVDMGGNCQEITCETLGSLSINGGQQAKDDDNGAMHDTHSDKEQEIAAFSSVQDWVDSLSMEISYESDNGVDRHSNECTDELKRFASSRPRPPLHLHFGYGSPSELFEKVLFSEDEEIKARTETNSTASSSFSSNNVSQPAQHSRGRSAQVHAPSLRSWSFTPDVSGAIEATQPDGQRSWAGLLRKTRGALLSASSKPKVVVNGRVLSSAAVKQAEERAGKLRPGSYWYDYKAGFWGVEGGPCLGILPPYIEELNYPMASHCSNGDTQVYINGRELHAKDLALLSQRGLSRKMGRAYLLGFDGVLVDDSTGLELKHLGKLAPTVQRRGKGFGMFTADVLQSKAGAARQIKPSNSIQ